MVGPEICGARLSVRHNEAILSLWNKNAQDQKTCYRFVAISKYCNVNLLFCRSWELFSIEYRWDKCMCCMDVTVYFLSQITYFRSSLSLFSVSHILKFSAGSEIR